VLGIFLNRKNVIILLMAIELMLLAVNMNFIAFSHYLGDIHGQVFVFFILTVAAAESAIGLAILVVLFAICIRSTSTTSTISRADADGHADALSDRAAGSAIRALVAGLFGKLIGRTGAHVVTIAGVLVSFIASLLVFQDVLRVTPITDRFTPGWCWAICTSKWVF